MQVYTAKSVATSWNFRSSGASFYVLWCSVVAPRIVPQLFTSITYLPLLDLDQFRCKPSCKSVWTAVASTLETLWMWMVSAWIWGRSWGECYFSVFVDAICSVMSLWLMQRCDDFCTEQGHRNGWAVEQTRLWLAGLFKLNEDVNCWNWKRHFAWSSRHLAHASPNLNTSVDMIGGYDSIEGLLGLLNSLGWFSSLFVDKTLRNYINFMTLSKMLLQWMSDESPCYFKSHPLQIEWRNKQDI